MVTTTASVVATAADKGVTVAEIVADTAVTGTVETLVVGTPALGLLHFAASISR